MCMWMQRRRSLCLSVALAAFLVSGCSLLFGSGPEPTPTPAEQRALVPTFTPTTAPPPAPPTDTPLPPTPIPAPTAALTATQPLTNVQPVTGTQPVTSTQPVTGTQGLTTTRATTQTTQPITQTARLTQTQPLTPTVAAKAKLVINTDIANARLGPGTDYGLGGTANNGQEFDITGKTQAGDWWQVCCINGQQVWIFGELGQVKNAEGVPVVTNLPPKPVLVAPTQPPAAPAPTATPPPQQVQAPAAPDPCAGIGGDGCKFKLRNGPKFAPNANELKLQLAFIHSGIEGGQAQGSYFIFLLKDGQKLPIPDSVRSIALTKQQGALGQYNYEYKLGTSNIPGNNVAGNYVIYVLDGNGERDSKDFSFTVPDGQGEVWLEFDQG